MKISHLLVVCALLVVSCSPYTYTPTITTPTPPSRSQLWSSATYRSISVDAPVTPPLIADLKVSSEKISHTLIPSKALLKTDVENIIRSAVKEALNKNEDADVLIGMEHQLKYDDLGVLESVTVTGYPAKYTNFRHPSESIWLNNNTFIRDTNSDNK